MKILLVADSHLDDNKLKELANKHNNCDAYIHLGDSQSDENNISPFVSVKGNCDYNRSFPRSLSLNSPFGKIYCEHIPFYQTSIAKLKKDDYKVYLYGHTHAKKHEVIDGIHVINPGAITFPRDGSKSYAIIDLTENDIKVTFYEI